jgi:hypothetical protein
LVALAVETEEMMGDHERDDAMELHETLVLRWYVKFRMVIILWVVHFRNDAA